MAALEYNCPHCNSDLSGSFGDNVYCEDCDMTYETEWDYFGNYSPGGWLTGVEHEGKIDIEEDE